MNLVMLVSMIVSIIVSLGFLIAPVAILGMAGFNLDPIGVAMARQFAGTLLSLAILLWLARRSASLEFKHGAVITMFAYYLITGLVMLAFQFTVQPSPMLWGLIGLHLVFIVWFGYYLVRKPT